MINPKYAVKCLKLGFLRYQRYGKLPITIDVSKNTISFYAKNRTCPSVAIFLHGDILYIGDTD